MLSELERNQKAQFEILIEQGKRRWDELPEKRKKEIKEMEADLEWLKIRERMEK
jgi:hypothetical protein